MDDLHLSNKNNCFLDNESRRVHSYTYWLVIDYHLYFFTLTFWTFITLHYYIYLPLNPKTNGKIRIWPTWFSRYSIIHMSSIIYFVFCGSLQPGSGAWFNIKMFSISFDIGLWYIDSLQYSCFCVFVFTSASLSALPPETNYIQIVNYIMYFCWENKTLELEDVILPV